tara:strand:+ start:473 stop:661 length:189 start_codon:yes stop_codon:yes gene_type:complete
MSDVPDMISAVISDDKVEAETHFKNTMAQKIGGALDLKRIEVANSLVKSQPEPVEDTADEKV